MAMSVPNLPTDNLYKFLSLGGLLLGVVSLSLNILVLDNYSQQAINLFRQDLEINKNLKEVNLRLKTLTPEVLKDNKELVRLYSETLKSENNNKILQKEVDNITPSYEIKNNLLNFATATGFLVSAAGFILWYEKLQKYEDKIVKKKALPNRL